MFWSFQYCSNNYFNYFQNYPKRLILEFLRWTLTLRFFIYLFIYLCIYLFIFCVGPIPEADPGYVKKKRGGEIQKGDKRADITRK